MNSTTLIPVRCRESSGWQQEGMLSNRETLDIANFLGILVEGTGNRLPAQITCLPDRLEVVRGNSPISSRDIQTLVDDNANQFDGYELRVLADLPGCVCVRIKKKDIL